jgi:hypothetical protein
MEVPFKMTKQAIMGNIPMLTNPAIFVKNK